MSLTTMVYTLHELDSDHNPISFSLQKYKYTNIQRKVLDYNNVDWEKFRAILDSNIKINNKITTAELDTEVNDFIAAIQKAQQSVIKQKIFTDQWLDLPDEIVAIIQQRNKVRKKWQQTGLHSYKKLCNTLSREIKTEVIDFS